MPDNHAPAIGKRREYVGDELLVLYPGETATAIVGPLVLDDVIAAGGTLPIEKWVVEPLPGWHGRWLRWRYRLIGQWLTARSR